MPKRLPNLPPTWNIKDPEIRAFCDAVFNGWQVMSSDTEGFVTVGQARDVAAEAVSDVFSGKSTLGSPAAGGSGGVAQIIDNVAKSVTETQLFRDLTTRIDLTDVATLSNQVSTISSTLDGNTSTVKIQAVSINGLQSQYTVKIDTNGFVTGFGLASEPKDDTPFSDFIVNADRFTVSNPSGALANITSLTRVGATATLVWADAAATANSPAGTLPILVAEKDSIVIRNAADSKWNGTWRVDTVNNATKTLTFTVATEPATPAQAVAGKTLKIGAAAQAFVVVDGKVYIQNALIKDLTADNIKARSLTVTSLDQLPTVYIGAFATAPTLLDDVYVNSIYKNTTDGNSYVLVESGGVKSWTLYLAKGDPAKGLMLSATSQIFQIPKSGSVSPSSITLTAYGQNLTGNPTFTVETGTATLTGTGTTRTLTYANMSSDVVTIKADWGALTDKITIVKVREGTDAVNALLTNETISLPADANGNVLSYLGASTAMKVFIGSVEDTANWTFSKVDSGLTSSISSDTVSLTTGAIGASVNSGYVDITASKTGYASITKTFYVSKNKTGPTGAASTVAGPTGPTGSASTVPGPTGPGGATGPTGANSTVAGPTGPTGATGSNAVGLTLSATATAFTYDKNGALSPASQSIGLTAVLQNITGTVDFSAILYNSSGSSIGSVTLANATSTTANFTPTSLGVAAYAKITATLSGYTDSVTVFRIQNGADGTNGTNGTNAVNGFVTRDSFVLKSDAYGKVPSTEFTGATGTFKVYNGTTDVSSSSTFSVPTVTSGITVTITSSGGYGVTAMIDSVDSGTATLRAVYGSITIDKTLTITKAKNGIRGSTSVVATTTLSSWSNTEAETALANTGNGSPVNRDQVTLINNSASPPLNETRFYDASSSPAAWVVRTSYINGNLLVDGTVSGDKIVANSISVGKLVDRPIIYIGAFSVAPSTTNEINSVYKNTTDGNSYILVLSSGVKTWTLYLAKGADGTNGTSAKAASLSATSQVFQIAKSGTVTPSAITFSATGQNVSGSPAFTITGGTLTGSGTTCSLSYANMTADTASVTMTWDGISDSITVVKVREGTDTVNAVLSNESHVLPADAGGAITSYTGASTTMKVYVGATDDTANWTFTKADNTGVTSTISTNVVTISGLTVDSSYVDISASKTGYSSITKRFSVSRAKTGATGSTGSTGNRGNVNVAYAITGSTWSDSDAGTAVAGAAAGSGFTSPQSRDIVTLYNTAAGYSQTKYYSSGSWLDLTSYINGNMLVTGTVTAAKLDVGDTSQGLKVNTASTPDAVYVYQNAQNTYGLYCINAWNSANGGGAASIQSVYGYTLQSVLTGNTSTQDYAAFAASATASNGTSQGGDVRIGVPISKGGYAGYANRGTWSPFTGSHDALVDKGEQIEQGDILVDGEIVAVKINDSLTICTKSTSTNQKAALGVYVSRHLLDPVNPPAAFRDGGGNAEDYTFDYNVAVVNAVGEGAINVCGEGGDIQAGDLIVTSSIPGKGMRQSDDIVRATTVAKARESVTFSSPGEVKMIGCIYLCG